MVKYFYDKYSSIRLYEMYVEVSNGLLANGGSYMQGSKTYTFDKYTGKFTLGTIASYPPSNDEPVYVSKFDDTLEAYKRGASGARDEWDFIRYKTRLTSTYERGNLVQSNIEAENGTYPNNGRHTDGFWYVRKSVVNNAPSLTLATTDNRTLYENDQFNVTGQVTDTDVGNVVTTKYSINGGTERAITATISQGTALTYNKVLTFKQGKLFDGANAITDTLADGSQHVLRVWAEDDKGGKSAEQVRVFYVVANRSAVLTINPVTSVSDLIDSDTIAISGNVSDPDGNTVTVRYKIGNGLYTQVYSGTGGAFNFNVSLADLQTGVNTVTIQATDSYGLSTTKTLRVTKSANNKPLLKSVATYKLTPPNGSADGIVLWVQRETGDLIVNAEISMGANGAVENFVPMVKDSTAYVTDAIEEDEFTFDNGAVSAENIVVRLTMERTSATSDKGIKLISGVLS